MIVRMCDHKWYVTFVKNALHIVHLLQNWPIHDPTYLGA